MTPRKHLLVLTSAMALAFCLSRTHAQEYQPFPTKATVWEVVRCFYFYQPGWYDRHTITMDGSDTLYEGKTFKNIYIRNHHLPGTIHDSVYATEYFGGLREEDKRIYIFQKWASTDTTVRLVYDFSSTNVGDTIFTHVLSGNPNMFGHVVVATDSVLVGSTYHKRLLLQEPGNVFNTEYWIEGIGSSWGLPFASFWSITDNSYDLTCFYRNDELLYVNQDPVYGFCQTPLPDVQCDPVLSIGSLRIPDAGSFVVFPNPAVSVVTIDVGPPLHPNTRLEIYNLAGGMIRSVAVTQEQSRMYIGDLHGGMYFLVRRSDDRIERNQLLMIRR